MGGRAKDFPKIFTLCSVTFAYYPMKGKECSEVDKALISTDDERYGACAKQGVEIIVRPPDLARMRHWVNMYMFMLIMSQKNETQAGQSNCRVDV